MSTTQSAYLPTRTFEAGEVLAANTGCYLKSDGKIYNADNGLKPPNVWTNEAAAASGDLVSCSMAGPTRLGVCGGTVTVGSIIQTGAGGLLEDAGANDSRMYAGWALETGASGETIEFMHVPFFAVDVSTVDAD